MTALPPKPTHNFFPLRFSPPPPPAEGERQEMIAIEAYLLAERRGFEAGHEAEDWVKAEAAVDARLAHMRALAGS